MQSLNLNHQNEVNQLLANVNELLCSPTTISSSCCCKVSDLKMQVLQLRNDILTLGYGTFLRRLKQYKSMYQQLRCKICNGNVDAMCEFGRQLYIDQVESITYSISGDYLILSSIITTIGSVVSDFGQSAFNAENGDSIPILPDTLFKVDVSSSQGSRLIITFVVTDGGETDLRFSMYIVNKVVVATSVASIEEGAGYPISSNYYIRENTNKVTLTPQTTYIGYTSTKTTTLSIADGADILYNDLSHLGYYDVNSVFSNTLNGNAGNRVLQSRIALRQTCLTQNTSCTSVTPSIVFDSVGSSYNSGTDTATFVFTDTSNYQGNPIDYISFEEVLNGIYVDSTGTNISGTITIVGSDIVVSINDYATLVLDSDWNVVISVMLKTCDNPLVSEIVINVNDLPQPPEV